MSSTNACQTGRRRARDMKELGRPKEPSRDKDRALQPSILAMTGFEGGTIQVPGPPRTPASSVSGGMSERKLEHMKEGS